MVGINKIQANRGCVNGDLASFGSGVSIDCQRRADGSSVCLQLSRGSFVSL